jgi:hypothetical protein
VTPEKISERLFTELNYLIAVLGVIFNNIHRLQCNNIALQAAMGGIHA